MIERLLIRNFQKHKVKDIIFHSNVTAITGYSDTGKSSILRALKWACLNKPRGIAYISHGEKKVKAVVKISDVTIKRERSKTDNLYAVKRNGEITKSLSIGNDVPEDVQKMFMVGEENFQGQHDPPFWFSLTAGELAKALNKIVNLESIDKAIADIGKEVKDNKAREKFISERKEGLEGKVKSYEYVEQLADEFKGIFQTDSKLHQIKMAHESMVEIIESILQCSKTIVSWEKCLRQVGIIINRGYELKTKVLVVSDLRKVITSVLAIQKEANKKIPNIIGLRKILEVLVDVKKDLVGLKYIIDGVIAQKKYLENKKQEMEKVMQLMKECDVCPICGKEM